MSTRHERRVVAKTADYTINPALDSPGTVFTNGGASGAVIFTLPAPGQGTRGWWYRFVVLADQNVTVKTATADTLLTKNDAAADSVAVSTSGEKIGAVMEAQCVETAAGTFRWAVAGLSVGHTFTIAT